MFRYRIGAGSVADSALNISEQTASPHFAIIETRTVGDDGSPLQLISYQYDNHLGSATLELDGSASIISYEEYYPYGMSSYQAVTSQREVCKKRYRFTGKERDEESGLYYFGARYYDADIGLWTSTDPAGQFWDLYAYAGNGYNPINAFDPDGNKVIAGDKATFNAYPSLLRQMSPQARQRIAILEKSDLVYTITIDPSFPKQVYTFTESGDVIEEIKGGGCRWIETGADITYTRNDAATLAHELAGHGYQRDLADQKGVPLDVIKNAYANNPDARKEFEKDAFGIAGQTWDAEAEKLYGDKQ